MIISLHFRERLSGVLQVVQDELDNLVAVIRTWSNVEHKDDGSHSPNVGNTLQFFAGANIGAGQPVYISAGADQTAPGQAFLADATVVSKSTQAAIVGLATTSVSAGANVITRDRGIFSGLVGLQAGKAYYVGTTPGSLTLTTPTNAALIGLAISTTELLLLLRNPTIIAQQALVTWTGTTSGNQNMAAGSVLAFTTPGTYSITVSTTMTIVVRCVSGGGGGGTSDNNGGGNGAGGGGGAYSTGGGNSVSFVTGKTYTAVVGAGGAAGAAGGGTTFINTTDSFTIIDEGGGQAGSPNITAGNGGNPNAGVITAGGSGGAGGGNGNGTTGGNAANGAAGGGGGGGAAPGNGAQGGAGSAAAGTGGPPGVNGTNNGGLAGGFGTGATGGGAGGGGGAQIAGVSGSFGGGGGGGAWGTGNGGAGQGGVVVLTFVSAP